MIYHSTSENSKNVISHQFQIWENPKHVNIFQNPFVFVFVIILQLCNISIHLYGREFHIQFSHKSHHSWLVVYFQRHVTYVLISFSSFTFLTFTELQEIMKLKKLLKT